MDGYEDLGLRGGLWRGQITRGRAPGRILLVHMGEVLAEAEVTPRSDGVWQVGVALPADRLTDGAATFSLHEDAGAPGEALQPGSTVLATLPVIAGKALHRDLRAELTLLRAELDLLKREFRRHAAEAGPRAVVAAEAAGPRGDAGAPSGAAERAADEAAGGTADETADETAADGAARDAALPAVQDAPPVAPLDAPVETSRPEPA